MAKLTIVLGLSGSGKTYIAERLATGTGAKLFSDFWRAEDKNLAALKPILTVELIALSTSGDTPSPYSVKRFWPSSKMYRISNWRGYALRTTLLVQIGMCDTARTRAMSKDTSR